MGDRVEAMSHYLTLAIIVPFQQVKFSLLRCKEREGFDDENMSFDEHSGTIWLCELMDFGEVCQLCLSCKSETSPNTE